MTSVQNDTTRRDELAAALMDAFERASTSRGGQHWENVADAILFEYLLVPRAELPKVTLSDHGNGLCTALAQEDFQPQLRRGAGDEGPAFNRRIALSNLAVAEAIEMRDKAQAETKLQLRRDALAHEIIMGGKTKYGPPWAYANATPALQRAVDRIVELEAAAEATK